MKAEMCVDKICAGIVRRMRMYEDKICAGIVRIRLRRMRMCVDRK